MSNSPKFCTLLYHCNLWGDGDAWSKWFGLMPPKKASCSRGYSLQFCLVGNVGRPMSEVCCRCCFDEFRPRSKEVPKTPQTQYGESFPEQAGAQSIDHQNQHLLVRLKYAEVKRFTHTFVERDLRHTGRPYWPWYGSALISNLCLLTDSYRELLQMCRMCRLCLAVQPSHLQPTRSKTA